MSTINERVHINMNILKIDCIAHLSQLATEVKQLTICNTDSASYARKHRMERGVRFSTRDADNMSSFCYGPISWVKIEHRDLLGTSYNGL